MIRNLNMLCADRWRLKNLKFKPIKNKIQNNEWPSYDDRKAYSQLMSWFQFINWEYVGFHFMLEFNPESNKNWAIDSNQVMRFPRRAFPYHTTINKIIYQSKRCVYVTLLCKICGLRMYEMININVISKYHAPTRPHEVSACMAILAPMIHSL